MEGLKSGVVLCKVANLVKPGVIASKKIKVPSPASPAAAATASATATAATILPSSNAFGAMDNVAEFLNACKVIGVKEQVSSHLPLLPSFFLFLFSSLLLSSFFSFPFFSLCDACVCSGLTLVLFFVFSCVCCAVLCVKDIFSVNDLVGQGNPMRVVQTLEALRKVANPSSGAAAGAATGDVTSASPPAITTSTAPASPTTTATTTTTTTTTSAAVAAPSQPV